MNKLLITIFLLGIGKLNAQELILQGKITFERGENMHKLIDDEIAAEDEVSVWYTEMRKAAPKYRKDIFEMNFNTHQSLYQMTKEDEEPFNQRWFRVAYANKVLLDFDKNTFASNKTVYDKDFLVTDSLPLIQWKLVDEYRNIAGKNCRKATTILFDSVFVIAFYTDEIPVSAGPETFQGLPGMILGIVIPRIHYTIFATQIQGQLLAEKELVMPPVKRKTATVTIGNFKKEMLSSFKDWDKDAIKVYWRVMF